MDKTDYRNAFAKENYDRISLNVPKGFRGVVKKCAKQNGISVNEYITRLINRDIDANGNSRLAAFNRFDDKQKALLQKWQIARKYHDMIEAVSDTDGYYVLLKDGYVNDVTGCRTLQAESMHDIRLIITKSHPIRNGVLVEGLDEETIEQLDKWQIPKKYYPMIESISSSKSNGHTIVLKAGYINDHSNSNVIHADKASLFRSVMKYTHKKPQTPN